MLRSRSRPAALQFQSPYDDCGVAIHVNLDVLFIEGVPVELPSPDQFGERLEILLDPTRFVLDAASDVCLYIVFGHRISDRFRVARDSGLTPFINSPARLGFFHCLSSFTVLLT